MQNIFFNYFRNIRYKYLDFKNSKYFNEIKKLRNSKKHKSIFIFGNGKSLNILNLNKIHNLQKKKFDVMVMNNFFSSKKSKKIKPTFWLTTDKRVINPKKKYFYKNIEKYRDIVSNLKHIQKLSCKILLPHNIISTTIKKNIVFFNGYINISSKNYFDVTRSRNLFYLSGITAISIAKYFGYKKIYICGLDNDQWITTKVTKDNKVYFDSSYFYRKPKNSYVGNDIYEILYKFNNIYFSYMKLKSNNIINLDPKSTITYFNKKHKLDVY